MTAILKGLTPDAMLAGGKDSVGGSALSVVDAAFIIADKFGCRFPRPVIAHVAVVESMAEPLFWAAKSRGMNHSDGGDGRGFLLGNAARQCGKGNDHERGMGQITPHWAPAFCSLCSLHPSRNGSFSRAHGFLSGGRVRARCCSVATAPRALPRLRRSNAAR